MPTVLAGHSAAFNIDLKSPFDGVTATTWTLRGHNGLPMPGYVDVAGTPTENGTKLLVSLPSGVNTKTLPTENRFIVIKRSHPSGDLLDQFRYTLIDFYPIMSEPKDVRSMFGFNSAELADSEINLASAYVALLSEVGTSFTTAINAGGAQGDKAQRLVVLRACLDLLPSLRLRASASQNSDQAGFSRFQTVDLNEIERAVRAEYSRALEAVAPPTAAVVPDLFGVSANRDDPFPGA